MTPNQQAFLCMLATSEIGVALLDLAQTDNGYKVLVGATQFHPMTFDSYATHPNVYNRRLNSTAAGRYQIIHPTWLSLCKQHGYTDFTPDTQDAMAIDLITGRGAIHDIENDFASAVTKCSAEWASLPGGTSGQHENKFADLKQIFLNAGGIIDGQVSS